jgi:hypothetical protein
MKNFALSFFTAAALSTGSALAHEHYAAGYLDTNGNHIADAGDKLQLVTGPPSGMVFHMLMEPAGRRYAGYYALDEQVRTDFPNDYFAFIVLSDGQTEPDGPQHAATGSDVWMEITSVTGPEGGHFGFWNIDSNYIGWSYTHTTPTISFLANQPTGGYKFELSEPLTNPVAPTEDPFGHIHDRGFTADLPGTYTVGFTLYDMSTNGPGGGPIEQPSETYYFTFVAGTADATPTPTPPPTPTPTPSPTPTPTPTPTPPDGSTPTPTPTPTPPPTAVFAQPTVKITGAKNRTVSSSRIVLRGTATAAAGLTAVQLKTTGAYRTISRSPQWKATINLKPGRNQILIRVVDAQGRFSTVQRITIRRE